MTEKKRIKVVLVRGDSGRNRRDVIFPFTPLHIARYLDSKKGKGLPLDIEVLPDNAHRDKKGQRLVRSADVIIQSVSSSPGKDVNLIEELKELNPKALHMYGGPSYPLLTMGKTFERFRGLIAKNPPDVLIKGVGLGTGVDPVFKIIRHLYENFGEVGSRLITKENAEKLLEIIKKKESGKSNPGAGVMFIDRKGKGHFNEFETGVDTIKNLGDAFVSHAIRDCRKFMPSYPDYYKSLDDAGTFTVKISTSNGCPGSCLFCDPSYQVGKFASMDEKHFKEQFKNAIDAEKEYENERKSKKERIPHTIQIEIEDNELGFDELKWLREESEKLAKEDRKLAEKLIIRTFMKTADIIDRKNVMKAYPGLNELPEVEKIRRILKASEYLKEMGKLRGAGVKLKVFLGGDYFSDRALKCVRKGVTLAENKAAVLGLVEKGASVHLSAMPWVPVDPKDWDINIEHIKNLIKLPEAYREVWGKEAATGRKSIIINSIELGTVVGLYPRGPLGRALRGDRDLRDRFIEKGQLGSFEQMHISDFEKKPDNYVGRWGIESRSELLVPDWSPEGFEKVYNEYTKLINELNKEQEKLKGADSPIEMKKREFLIKARLQVLGSREHFQRCFEIRHPEKASEMRKRMRK